jgi:hypothetical protein
MRRHAGVVRRADAVSIGGLALCAAGASCGGGKAGPAPADAASAPLQVSVATAVEEDARLKVKEAIENVSGVGAVNLIGPRTRAVNVVLDLDRLHAAGVPIGLVKAALASQNVEIPSGRIDRGASEQALRTLARVRSAEEFERLVVATRGDRQITIGALGRVEDSVEEPRTLARLWKAGDEGRGKAHHRRPGPLAVHHAARGAGRLLPVRGRVGAARPRLGAGRDAGAPDGAGRPGRPFPPGA